MESMEEGRELVQEDNAQLANAMFRTWFNKIQQRAFQINTDNGWWEEDPGEPTKIALMHSELSEALEGVRHDNPPSDHIPEFLSTEEEYADVIIRIMDNAQKRGYRVADAIVAKLEFNRGRGYMHGGKSV